MEMYSVLRYAPGPGMYSFTFRGSFSAFPIEKDPDLVVARKHDCGSYLVIKFIPD